MVAFFNSILQKRRERFKLLAEKAERISFLATEIGYEAHMLVHKIYKIKENDKVFIGFSEDDVLEYKSKNFKLSSDLTTLAVIYFPQTAFELQYISSKADAKMASFLTKRVDFVAMGEDFNQYLKDIPSHTLQPEVLEELTNIVRDFAANAKDIAQTFYDVIPLIRSEISLHSFISLQQRLRRKVRYYRWLFRSIIR